MSADPQIGDLVYAKSGNLGIVIRHKPKQVVGASWVPERYVIWWLSNDKKTTEFLGDSHNLIEVVSSADKGVHEKRN